MVNFTKIKRAAGKMELRWRTDAGENDDLQHELSSFDEPLPEFEGAMQALKPEVLRLLELPSEYGDDLKVSGISINYEKADDRMGAVITLQKQLSAFNAPLIFNTPHLPEPGDDDRPSLPHEVIRLLDLVQEQARRYVDGARAQADLFSDPVAEAVADLAPKRDSGIDSITISTADHSVTLTAEDGERIRKNLRKPART